MYIQNTYTCYIDYILNRIKSQGRLAEKLTICPLNQNLYGVKLNEKKKTGGSTMAVKQTAGADQSGGFAPEFARLKRVA